MVLDIPASSWRNREYLVSTDLALIQTDKVNQAFASDLMWWAQGLPRETMGKALGNSLCFGLYEVIGFARLITDGVTFAWLTDVYVREEYQGRGLARFMMEAIHDTISEWKYLRRFMLLASDSMDLYRKTLGVKDWRELGTDDLGVGVLEGPGGKHPDH
ncbi:uncharacterized protein B0I36DRAFT_247245 [Microdochium trichocladiopsis]|uniref:N-acetyltransferase domain-containing protein n=1 Tax=Microdochium trichocladiopsis TaxID=1682393 RepID=A0A9P8Y2J5_9PEZI|nr:uncharacterized protein B0I36DRAFT_247245 [Microdochium trichocladiopsis]KAH7028020.1 hypothetical protein B0I36DRAFT_247245 [Microdochium trichocladiopsis]